MLKQTLASIAFGALLINGATLAAHAEPAVESSAPTAAHLNEKPPAAEAPRPLKMPAPTTYKLANGLTVIMLEDHRVPFITFQLGIRAGDSYDPKDMSGVATITADMLNEGTEKHTSKEIAKEIDFIGGAVKASSDADFTVVSGSALSKYTNRFFSTVAEMVLHPSFPENELKLEKTNMEHSLALKHAEPDFLADERFHKVVFGNNPYSVVAPTKESIERITRDEVLKFHAQHYLPNAATLVIVGDFHQAPMKALIEKEFGGWAAGNVPTAMFDNPPEQKGRRIYIVDRPGSVQTCVRIGNLGIKKNDPDYFKAVVANQVLGGSPSSRLFMNIREQKSYTYGAYSSFGTHKNGGEFTATGSVRTAVTAPALEEYLYELDRVRNVAVSPAELQSAKNYLIGNFQLGFESQGGIAQRLLEQNLYDLPADYLQTYTDKIAAVTPEDVRRVARKHIDFNNLVITVCGDAKQIEPELRFFAPVEVFDTAGKTVREDKDKEPSNNS